MIHSRNIDQDMLLVNDKKDNVISILTELRTYFGHLEVVASLKENTWQKSVTIWDTFGKKRP